MNKTRLEAFSDGVFAIIITIMVLEIRIPTGAGWDVLQPLIPTIISYILSFIFVGIYWGNHHHMLHAVKKVSSGIIWANMSLLFCLSLIPFATGWMGENHFATNTVIVYSILLLLCGITYTILQLTIQRCTPMSPKMKIAFSNMRKKGIISVICYSSAIPLAYINTIISGLLFFLVSIIWIIPDKGIEHAIEE